MDSALVNMLAATSMKAVRYNPSCYVVIRLAINGRLEKPVARDESEYLHQEVVYVGYATHSRQGKL